MNTHEESKTTVTAYAGTNEKINELLQHFPDDRLFIVQGVNGRTVIVAGCEEEAKTIYNSRENKWKK